MWDIREEHVGCACIRERLCWNNWENETYHHDCPGVPESPRDVAGRHERPDLEQVRGNVQQGGLQGREAEAGDDNGAEVGDDAVGDLRGDGGDEEDVESGSG